MRTRLSVAAALVALLCSAPASAQDEAMVTAKNHFDDGQNLYLQGKFAEAAEKFVAAYAAKPYAAFLFNIAVCYEKNKDLPQALEYYERFLRDEPKSRDRPLVEQRVTSLRERVNPPTTRPPATQPAAPLPEPETKGLVVIESAPGDAAIYLDEKSSGVLARTPYTGSLPHGEHTVIIELREYRTERKTFIVRNDRLTYLYFGLSIEKDLGWIEVQANVPGADVYLDDKGVGAVGRTPYSGNQRPGKRKLIVERAGYEPLTREIEIVAGKAHTLRVELKKVAHGWLRVTGQTTKDATLTIDGKPVHCAEFPCRTPVAPGTHRVALARKGYKPFTQELAVQQAHEVKLAVRLNPKPPRIKAYVSFGIAAALLTGGIVAGVMSKDAASSLQEDLDNHRLYDTGDPRFTKGKVTAIIANTAFGLGGLTAALGVYYLLRNEGPDSYGEQTTKKIAVTPAFGPGGAGLSGVVSF